MPFEIIRHDITKMHVEAIVNAANSGLLNGGGVCGAIFSAAGPELLQTACDQIGYCAVGEAVLTEGFKLKATYIIHTVGPVWRGGGHQEEELLKSCYLNSLMLARRKGIESIAFPLIASGIYGYPKEEALKIAMEVIKAFLAENDMMVYLVVFDKRAVQLSRHVMDPLKQFIDDHYVEEHEKMDSRSTMRTTAGRFVGEVYSDYSNSDRIRSTVSYSVSKKRKLEDVVAQLDESFTQMLLRLIDEKGMTDVETYRKANVDRRLFSKIRKDIHYCPSKPTAIAFAIALELSLDSTKDLLGKAGYSLSRSNMFDVIIEYFIENEVYDIFVINEGLFFYDQALLV
jgi:O-acetyl-ADP-ribose deacetylase (regulator of RNase III)